MAALLFGMVSEASAQSAAWGWETDTLVMSFFGGVPYRGCERAFLSVPDPGQTGQITAITYTSIVVGLSSCSWSTVPSSLNANTIRTRTQVLRNGQVYQSSNCTTATKYNSTGLGLVNATTSSACSKNSTSGYRWSVSGTYGWYDYDDTTWRSETVENPSFTQ